MVVCNHFSTQRQKVDQRAREGGIARILYGSGDCAFPRLCMGN